MYPVIINEAASTSEQLCLTSQAFYWQPSCPAVVLHQVHILCTLGISDPMWISNTHSW